METNEEHPTTHPTLEQVEAARAEYDRSEDMCAALVAAAGVTPREPVERALELRQTISDLRLELADAGEGWRAALEAMESHKCHDQAERAYARAVAAEDALAAPVQVAQEDKK